jgi:hypothetical protein
LAVAGATQAAQRSGVCYPGITVVLKFYLKKETTSEIDSKVILMGHEIVKLL